MEEGKWRGRSVRQKGNKEKGERKEGASWGGGQDPPSEMGRQETDAAGTSLCCHCGTRGHSRVAF